MRVLWWLVYNSLFRLTPPQLYLWRAFLLRLFGANITLSCRVYPRVRIWAPWNLVMRDNSCLANDVICYNQSLIEIHEGAIVSQGAHLCTGTHDYRDPVFPLITKPIVIGKEAWIAAEAFVGPGVTIGSGAVLGARSVTFIDLEDWSVFSGNPARKINTRVINR